MTDPSKPADLDHRAPLRIAGLAALLVVLIAGIWSLWGPGPYDRWQYALFPLVILLSALRTLARKPWSRRREGAAVKAILNDHAVEERPRLTAAVDALGVSGLLLFLALMARWMVEEAEWARLAALTPLTLTVAGFVLLRLKQSLRPA